MLELSLSVWRGQENVEETVWGCRVDDKDGDGPDEDVDEGSRSDDVGGGGRRLAPTRWANEGVSPNKRQQMQRLCQ